MILLALSLFKIGLYFPAPYAPLGTWGYVSARLFPVDRGWHISGGYSNEPVLRPRTILGHNVTEMVGKNAWFLSGAKAINKDLDFDAGIKHHDGNLSPFVSISFKLGSLEGA